MRRKLYSSKKVLRTGLVWTSETEKEIQEQKIAQIYVFAPKRLLLLIEKNRQLELSFN